LARWSRAGGYFKYLIVSSPQLFLRFYQDVIALKPDIVHIMVGTNDIAGNTGPTSVTEFHNNIRAMVDSAQANGIAVILGSIPPAARFPWRPDLVIPPNQITELNHRLKDYATARKVTHADYFSQLVAADGGMKPEDSFDGVHPGTVGYRVMRTLAESAIAAAQAQASSLRTEH
jgi:lysophospholipase L1-like esterase